MQVADNNTLQIDTELLWNGLLERAKAKNFQPYDADLEDEFLKRVPGLYKNIMHKDLPSNRMATYLNLDLQLMGDEGIEDQMNLTLIMLAPKAPFEKIISQRAKQIEDTNAANRKRAAEQQRVAEEANAESRRRAAEQQKKMDEERQTQSKPGRANSTDERIKELEARLRRVEAALDSVLKERQDK